MLQRNLAQGEKGGMTGSNFGRTDQREMPEFRSIASVAPASARRWVANVAPHSFSSLLAHVQGSVR